MTLDDLTAMMAADEHHRYEISPEGVLSIMPLPGYAPAIIATRLMVWLAQGGVPADRIAQAVGLRIPGRLGGVGGGNLRHARLLVEAAVDGDALPRPLDALFTTV